MAWLTRTDWHLDAGGPKPDATDLNNFGLDIRTWGGNADAANNELINLAAARFRVAALPASPVEGMVAYDLATHTLQYRDNVGWKAAGGANQTPWTQAIDGAGYDLSGLGNLTLGAGKTATAPGQHRCSVYATADVSIPNNANTVIPLASEGFDVGALHDPAAPTRITIAATGFYRMAGMVCFAPNATGLRYAQIYKNGTLLLAQDNEPNCGVSDNTYVAVSREFPLAAGDYLELFGKQTSGGPLNAVGGGETYLSVTKLW